MVGAFIPRPPGRPLLLLSLHCACSPLTFDGIEMIAINSLNHHQAQRRMYGLLLAADWFADLCRFKISPLKSRDQFYSTLIRQVSMIRL